MLTSLWLYSNALRSIPETMQKMPSLRQMWIEGNDALNGDALDAFVSQGGHKTPRRSASTNDRAPRCARETNSSPSRKLPKAPAGYFKLVRWNGSEDEDARVGPRARRLARNAPGVPNWGGLLKNCVKPSETATRTMSYTCATSNGRGTRPTISESIKTPSFDDGTRRCETRRRDTAASYISAIPWVQARRSCSPSTPRACWRFVRRWISTPPPYVRVARTCGSNGFVESYARVWSVERRRRRAHRIVGARHASVAVTER